MGSQQVIQGSFIGGRPQIAVQARRSGGAGAPGSSPAAPGRFASTPGRFAAIPGRFAPGAVQRSPNGYSIPLPESVLAGRRGGGRPIPDGVRQKMEKALGADFSDVRIHVGPEASSIGALAFAHGSDIYFATGQYDPATTHGQRLLGHELTHVVQQRAGRVRNPYGSGVAVVQDPNLEAEAERMGMLAAAQPKMANGPVRTPAPHVAAALAPARPAVAPTAGRAAVQPKGEGYKIVVGSYMHQGDGAAQLPEEVAGHTFVSIQAPAGKSETWGFSPAGFSEMNARRELGNMRAGVPGRVHRDDNAFAKPGVKLRTYEVSRDQAQAAMAKVSEYKSRHYGFNLENRQCSTFALDVARAARVDPFPGARVKRPRDIYRNM